MRKPSTITTLREIFIIDALLDCKKKRTRELVDSVNDSTNKYFEIIGQNRPKDLTNRSIDSILKNLKKEGIIDRELDEEHHGRGPISYRYWLVKDVENYFKVLKKFNPVDNDEVTSIGYGLNFIESSFAKSFSDEDLLSIFESRAELTLVGEIKEYTSEIIKFSPKALKMLYEFPNKFIPNIRRGFMKNPNFDGSNNFSFHLNSRILNTFLITLTNSFIDDITHHSYPPFNYWHPEPMPMEVNSTLHLLVDSGESYNIRMGLTRLQQSIKIEKEKERVRGFLFRERK